MLRVNYDDRFVHISLVIKGSYLFIYIEIRQDKVMT